MKGGGASAPKAPPLDPPLLPPVRRHHRWIHVLICQIFPCSHTSQLIFLFRKDVSAKPRLYIDHFSRRGFDSGHSSITMKPMTLLTAIHVSQDLRKIK